MWSKPPAGPPLATAAWFNLEYAQPLSALGAARFATPLSVRGPGCSGALLIAVSDRISRARRMAISSLRLGKRALFQHPLAPVGRTKAAVDALGDGVPWRTRVNTCTPCPRCGAAPEDPYHVLTECPHGPTRARRAARTAVIHQFIGKLVGTARLCADPSGLPPRDIAERAPLAGRDAAELALTADWNSAAGRFVLYRLLAVASWDTSVQDAAQQPGAAADAAQPPLAAAGAAPAALPGAGGQLPAAEELAITIATALEGAVCKPHRVRPLANMWMGWASTAVQDITAAWFAGEQLAAAVAGGHQPPNAAGSVVSDDSKGSDLDAFDNSDSDDDYNEHSDALSLHSERDDN